MIRRILILISVCLGGLAAAQQQAGETASAMAQLGEFQKQLSTVGFDNFFQAEEALLLRDFKSKEGERVLSLRADESRVVVLSKSKEPLVMLALDYSVKNKTGEGTQFTKKTIAVRDVVYVKKAGKFRRVSDSGMIAVKE